VLVLLNIERGVSFSVGVAAGADELLQVLPAH
jgi:hypothetical protein